MIRLTISRFEPMVAAISAWVGASSITPSGAQLAAVDGKAEEVGGYPLLDAGGGKVQVLRRQAADAGDKAMSDPPAQGRDPVKKRTECGAWQGQDRGLAAGDDGQGAVAVVQRGKFAEVVALGEAGEDHLAPLGGPVQRDEGAGRQEVDVAAGVLLVEQDLPRAQAAFGEGDVDPGEIGGGKAAKERQVAGEKGLDGHDTARRERARASSGSAAEVGKRRMTSARPSDPPR